MTKQVLVLRKDLNMRKGKMVAQGSHASSKEFFDRFEKVSETETTVTYQFTVTKEENEWIEGRFTKVCVGADSEQELLAIYEKAKASGVASALIQDAGLTEFGGVPTYTAVGIGPASV